MENRRYQERLTPDSAALLLVDHQVGLFTGVRDMVTDYCTVAVEMLKDNASPKAGELYGALDMPFAGLVGQLAGAFAKK